MPGLIRKLGAALGNLGEADLADPGYAIDPSEIRLRPQESTLLAFEPYRAQMNAIDEQLRRGTDPKKIPGYLGSGGACHAYRTPDGRVLKLPRIPQSMPAIRDGEELGDEPEVLVPLPPDDALVEYILPLEKGKHRDGLEQLVGGTEDDGGGVVCEMAPGKLWGKRTPAERNRVGQEHYEALCRGLEFMAAHGLVPDCDEEDLFYHFRKGFTIIDFGLAETDAPVSPTRFALAFVPVLFGHLRRTRQADAPIATGNFFAAYKNVFGVEALPALLELWHRQRLPFPEGYSSPADVGSPANMEDILDIVDEHLARRGEYDDSERDITIAHRPDVLLRFQGRLVGMQARNIKHATDELSRNGVHVVPWQPVSGWSEPAYSLMKRVDGVSLNEALGVSSSDELVEQTDRLFAGLCDGLVSSKDHFEPIVPGVTDPARYTVGTIAGDTEPKIWLTRMPEEVETATDPVQYGTELLRIANEVCRLERQTGRTLVQARKAVGYALEHCGDSERFGDGLWQAISKVFIQGEIVPIDKSFEERIQQLRTK
jgi:hypothetical protein